MRLFHTTLVGLALLATTRIGIAVTLPGPLVTPQWLDAHKDAVVVLDVRDDVDSFSQPPEFAQDEKSGARFLVESGGHIDGALLIDFRQIRTPKMVDGVKIMAQMPSAQQFSAVMAGSGVMQTDKPFVIAPVGDSVGAMNEAARQYFQMLYFGVPRAQLAILNGGTNAWIQAGLPVSTEKPARVAGDWQAGPKNPQILASLTQVKEALQQGRVQLIDARPSDQFLGLSRSPVVKAAGHLPGARSLPANGITRVTGASHAFLNADEYRQIYQYLGIANATPSITYCNTGHMASGAWFIHSEILGNVDARMYAGSMTEWTNLGNPVAGLPE